MNIEEILGAIRELACSQGFYGRLYEHLIYVKNNEPKQWKDIVKELEAKHFKDTLDMVLYFEC
jgi:hypothetical protein